MAKKTTKTNSTVSDIPVSKIAKSATGSAYRRAIRTGSVVVYRNGELRRVEAGGKSSVLKKLEPRVRIAKGSKFEIEPEPA